MTTDEKRLGTKTDSVLFLSLLLTAVVFGTLASYLSEIRTSLVPSSGPNAKSKFEPLQDGTWRFVVSGDSRNCGDIVMPTIATDSKMRYQPAFYWHLGDLRAIYKIDEDMAGAAQKSGQSLSCRSYLKQAWPDFVDHQILPFGTTRFYVGIGNHEVIPPKTGVEFSTVFEDWLLTPRRQMAARDQALMSTVGACQSVAAKEHLTPTTYYHWIRGKVDFVYLDNSAGSFPNEELAWFDCVIYMDRNNGAISTIVVGMHEALPGSLAADHAMCDESMKDERKRTESCESGRHVYRTLVDTKASKRIYVLASHSHFYMSGIFNNQPADNRLDGWIVGTAGAVRYPLPTGTKPGLEAIADVYGYLLGTVRTNGSIDFSFKEVHEADVTREIRDRYPEELMGWCFAMNSRNKDPESEETTNRCIPLQIPTSASPTTAK